MASFVLSSLTHFHYTSIDPVIHLHALEQIVIGNLHPLTTWSPDDGSTTCTTGALYYLDKANHFTDYFQSKVLHNISLASPNSFQNVEIFVQTSFSNIVFMQHEVLLSLGTLVALMGTYPPNTAVLSLTWNRCNHLEGLYSQQGYEFSSKASKENVQTSAWAY